MTAPIPARTGAEHYAEVHIFPTTVPDPTCTAAAPCAECRAWARDYRIDCCGTRRDEPCRADCAGEASR